MKIRQLYSLVWIVFPFTKMAYAYIAFHSGSKPQTTTNSLMQDPVGVVLMLLGIVCGVAGLVMARLLFGNVGFVGKIARMIKLDIPKTNADEYWVHCFFIYNVSLGLLETTAIFGLVGFLQSGSVPFIYVLLFVSLVGWVFAKPAVSHLEENILDGKME